jgi:hypothetical protein
MDNPAPPRRISKTRYVHGLQCHKQLWWRVHEPDSLELIPSLETRARYDEGHRVGERARRALPGGVMIHGLPEDLESRVQATKEALAAGAPRLYEASFIADGAYAAVDILDRTEDGYALIEVKATTRPRLHHLQDAAFQAWVLRRCGVDVSRVEIMRLDPECEHPHLERLFARDDVTEAIGELTARIPEAIAAHRRVLDGTLPDVPIGPYCTAPYPCAFMRRCWAGLPPHHVTTLYRAGAGAFDLLARGYRTVADLDPLPEEIDLDPAAARQIRAVRENRVVVEPGLAEALEVFHSPLAFLDFETVSPAIPVWPGCHPFEAVPVQFNVRRERSGAFEDVGWLAVEGEDPRPELAARLIEACRGAETIVAYHTEFEAEVIASLERALPERASALGEIRARLRDPLPIVRAFVYHPGFAGRFGLKSVAPALAPDVRYTGAVAAGRLASVMLSRLVLEGLPADFFDRETVRDSLRRYCALDTFATQRVLERLRELASS